MQMHFVSKYIKKNGRLEHASLSSLKQYEQFVSKLPEGQIVECFY